MVTAVVADQPEPQFKPLFGRSSTESSLRLAKLGKSKSKTQSPKFGFFGSRPRNDSDASQKMLISAPTDFRHLTSGSRHAFPSMPLAMSPPVPDVPPVPQTSEFLQIPRSATTTRPWEPETRRESLQPLQPLELSIYGAQNRLSPLLPQFDLPIMVPSPPPAYAKEDTDRTPRLHSQRSLPVLFHVPRRMAQESPPRSPTDGNESDNSPTSPVSATSPTHTTGPRETGRLRAQTAPHVEAIRARVANAMLEVEKLQKKIDDVVERQSLYTPSRPSSAHSSHSLARTLPDLEPMPSIPALPPSAPSFAERLHSEGEKLHRPPTTPPLSPLRMNSTNNGGSQRSRSQRRPSPPKISTYGEATDIMPPPLPLVLRPPLRKKKPFSEGLSNMVFPVPPRKRESSLDSVTNMPRPIKGADGFYQCIPANGANLSYDSLHSLSTSDDGDNSEARSPRSGYSPATPRELERCATFGQDGKGLPMSVGVAL